MKDDFEHLSDEEFNELRKTFYSQSYELVEEIQDAVLRMEASPDHYEELKGVQRNFHTLKGDSNAMGLTGIATVCHRIEDVLASLEDKTRTIDSNVVSLILRAADFIESYLRKTDAGSDGLDGSAVVEDIEAFLSADGANAEPETESCDYSDYQILEMDAAVNYGSKLYKVEIVFHPLLQEKSVGAFMVNEKIRSIGQVINVTPDDNSDEIEKVDRYHIIFSSDMPKETIEGTLIIAGVSQEANINEYIPPTKIGRETNQRITSLKSEILRIEASRVDTIMDLTGELIIGRSILEQISKEAANGLSSYEISSRLSALNTYIGKSVSGLQRGIMKMRMVPVNNIFRKFPRIVREICESKKKKAVLEFYGKEKELDKGIVDALGEPLVHIIRNAIDHGIEEPSARKAVGKPEEGKIIFRAYHEAAQIVIEISDDGRGVDGRALKLKALEKGFLDEETADKLSESETLNLMFIFGLSSSERVNEISGRGIGMDAVKMAIENMKGSIEVESFQGNGTTIRLRLPLTLAVLKGLLFGVGDRSYALPISAIVEVGKVMMDDLITVDGRSTLVVRDQSISVIHLDDLFLLPRSGSRKRFVLIMGIGRRMIGLIVDRLIGQQELVIKPVDHGFTQTDLVAGASVLGDGSVVFVLDAHAIFAKAVEKEKEALRGM